MTRFRRAAVAAITLVALLSTGFVTAASAVTYPRPFTVTVTWIDADGVERPVSGALVTVTISNIADPDDSGGSGTRTFTASTSGRTTVIPEFAPPSVREVRVRAAAPGGAIGGLPLTSPYLGQSLTLAESRYVLVGSTQELQIVLHPTTTVTGVVEMADGQPAGSAATVLLWHETRPGCCFNPVVEVPTDADGRFTATGVPVGEYRFEVRSAASGRLLDRSFHPGARTVDDATSFVTGAGPTTDVGTLEVGGWALPTERVAGVDRYATSVGASQEVFPEPLAYSPGVVYVASGQSFADALGASALAGAASGVLLLTAPNALPAAVEGELRRLQPHNVVLVGGTGVISPAVESRLRSIGSSWGMEALWRVGGVDRYDTSRRLVEHAQNVLGMRFVDGPVFIATGTNFPDALSAAAAAGSQRMPLLLTGGLSESELPAATVSLLDSLRPSRLYVAGGAGAVSALAMNAYAWPRNIPVARFAGTDRYETSRLINTVFFPRSYHAVIASGAQFPDALAAGPLASALQAPLVLTPPTCVPEVLARDLARRGVDVALLVGGSGALSARVAAMSTC